MFKKWLDKIVEKLFGKRCKCNEDPTQDHFANLAETLDDGVLDPLERSSCFSR